MDFNIDGVIALAKQAGEQIMTVWHQTEDQTKWKKDGSPVTVADDAANKIIVEGLEKIAPQVPILSEEGAQTPYEIRQHWTYFWLVDPLDGTKEFIKRGTDFAVNIALIHNTFPIFGLIYLPYHKICYVGSAAGAFKYENGQKIRLQVPEKPDTNNLVAFRSHSHALPVELEFMEKIGVKKIIPRSSAIKYCLLAEHEADLYYRQHPNMEWDSASGQAILEAAGGSIISPDGSRYAYNNPILTNRTFCCLAFQQIPDSLKPFLITPETLSVG